jgi:hypothetical protein
MLSRYHATDDLFSVHYSGVQVPCQAIHVVSRAVMTEVKRPKLDAHGYIVSWLRMRGDLTLLPRNCTGVVFNHLNQEEEEEEEIVR